jgi:hypothetical protein
MPTKPTHIYPKAEIVMPKHVSGGEGSEQKLKEQIAALTRQLSQSKQSLAVTTRLCDERKVGDVAVT